MGYPLRVRRPLALLVAALTACVLPNLDGLSGGASTPDGGAPDAPYEGGGDASPEAAAKTCDMSAPFTNVAPVAVNTSSEDYAATLSPDEREIWFARGFDLFHATRAKRSDPFGTGVPVALNTTADEADPSISADLLTLMFIREPGAGGSWDILVSTRASTATDFGTAKVLAGVVTSSDEVFPFVTDDRKYLYYASNQGSSSMDIWSATSTGADFATPTKVAELSSTSDDLGAVLTADQLHVYVASARSDGGAKGGLDIFRASRASASQPFGALTNVVELNTTFDERITWISPDRCRVYFDSTRSSGAGANDVWVAERVPK